ncbi:MAG TPA: HAD-IIA family hydrolase [Marmoricola sp.]|nr:HAD-IIA family hydrolase [Marmoricola sp.]
MTATESRLAVPPETILARYRGVICDLDGVVYRGSQPVPNAMPTLNTAATGGVPVVFATNNASRPPREVGEHLRQLGLGAAGWSVVTSAQAAAVYLRRRLRPGAEVLAVGGPGVALALHEAGLTPAHASDGTKSSSPEAVVQGAGPDVTWRDLAEAAYLVEAGAIWVATNLDATVPTARGRAPGNGALVGAVRSATSGVPHVTGKPSAELFDLARARLGTEKWDTIVVGDRLDTDIVGANAAGLDSMLVLGGASTLRDLAFADAEARPTYVACDLSGLAWPGLGTLTPGAESGIDAGVSAMGEPFVGRGSGPDLIRTVVLAAWQARQEARELSDDQATWDSVETSLRARGC